MEIEEVILDDGKYRFHKDEGVLQCERYGERWRDFLGDTAVGALFDECVETKKRLEEYSQLESNKQDKLQHSLDCRGIVRKSNEVVVGKVKIRKTMSDTIHKDERAMRTCLKCGEPFPSEGRFNRRCPRCRQRGHYSEEDWHGQDMGAER